MLGKSAEQQCTATLQSRMHWAVQNRVQNRVQRIVQSSMQSRIAEQIAEQIAQQSAEPMRSTSVPPVPVERHLIPPSDA